MTGTRPADILRQLEPPADTDAALLARFASARDSAAFAELVRRHGPLVLGVCRRVTGNQHDAEDAFQAAFLVLAQKVGALSNAALLGNWLYGVAFRVALRAKRAATRRRAREVTVPTMPDPPAPEARAVVPELGPVLDEELAALAEHYRAAILLCDLRGLSRADAAEALGVPEGTLSSRLANGRKKLAARLARRGIALPAAGLAAVLGTATASVPAELLARTCETVTDWAATGTAPAALVALTKGGLTMRLSLVFGSVLALGITGAVFAALPADEPPVPPKPALAADDKKPVAPPVAKNADVKPALGAPKLAHSFDVTSNSARALVWNPSGTYVALEGEKQHELLKQMRPAYIMLSPNGLTRETPGAGAPGEFLLAASNDGKGYATVLREDGLISGKHRLTFWASGDSGKGFGPRYTVARSVALDSTPTSNYTLSDDEKTYRAILVHNGVGADGVRFEVIEAGTKDRDAQKSLLKLGAGYILLAPNGARAAHAPTDKAVCVYDVDAGKKLFETTLPVSDKPSPEKTWRMAFSRDGTRLCVATGLGRLVVFDATGKALSELEGTDMIEAHPVTLSSDGRLLVCSVQMYKVEEARPGFGGKQPVVKNYRPTGASLVVWNTDTGKVLKSWGYSGSVVLAFSPTRPLLVVAERNGENLVRVGFWDFAADAK